MLVGESEPWSEDSDSDGKEDHEADDSKWWSSSTLDRVEAEMTFWVMEGGICGHG